MNRRNSEVERRTRSEGAGRCDDVEVVKGLEGKNSYFILDSAGFHS